MALALGWYQSKSMKIVESLPDDLTADRIEMHVMAWFPDRSAREWVSSINPETARRVQPTALDAYLQRLLMIPFRLGETQMFSGSCIHAGMSRWPCSTRQTSM
jgi:hypothetical protein